MAGKSKEVHGLEGKRFMRISNLAARWDCSTDRIYDLINKEVLRPWHPEGKAGRRGLLIEVKSILLVEEEGFLS